jgi:hypothetical protein
MIEKFAASRYKVLAAERNTSLTHHEFTGKGPHLGGDVLMQVVTHWLRHRESRIMDEKRYQSTKHLSLSLAVAVQCGSTFWG